MPLTSRKQAFDEFKAGTLHSGRGGPLVKSRRQAIAIALSVERRAAGRGRNMKRRRGRTLSGRSR